MLASSKFKEGFCSRISIPSLLQRLNVLLSVARTFALLESTDVQDIADKFFEKHSLTLVSNKREVSHR